MKRPSKLVFILAGLAVVCLVQLQGTQPSLAAITPYHNDLSGFNTAAGNPPVAINFDNIPKDTNITGATIQGVTFQGPGAPLFVVQATETYTPPADFTYRLFATSGENVLSPGGIVMSLGPNPAVENDDLTLIFTNPVKAFGFDLLYQSLDGYSLTSIKIFKPNGDFLYSPDQTNNMIPASANSGGGGSDFWGFVSDTADIAKIIIDESDGDANFYDSNIGFDTFRFNSVTPTPVPGSLLLLASGVLGLVGLRKKMKS